MERIQAAIQKAKEQRALPEAGAPAMAAGLAPRPATGRQTQAHAQAAPGRPGPSSARSSPSRG